MRNYRRYGWGGLIARALVIVVLVAGPGCGRAPGNPGPMAVDVPAGQARMPAQYIITLGPDADARVITDLYGHFGIRVVRELGHNVFLVILTEDPGPAAMEEIGGSDARIKAVQPNFIYRNNGPGNDR